MTKVLLLASVAAGAAFLPLGVAQAQTPFDWSGFYAGVHGGLLSGDVTVNEEAVISPGGGNISGAIAGFLAGYNFPMSRQSPHVFGMEADIGWANITGHGTPPSADCAVDYLYDLHSDAHFRVRAGAPMGTVMPFIAGGLALANLDVSEDCEALTLGGVYVGGTIGAGIDVKTAPNTILRGEFLYDLYGRKQYDEYSVDFSAWTIRAALIFRLP